MNETLTEQVNKIIDLLLCDTMTEADKQEISQLDPETINTILDMKSLEELQGHIKKLKLLTEWLNSSEANKKENADWRKITEENIEIIKQLTQYEIISELEKISFDFVKENKAELEKMPFYNLLQNYCKYLTEDESGKVERQIMKQQYNRPENLVIPITKLTDNLFGQGKVKDCSNTFSLQVSSKGAKNKAVVKDCKIYMPSLPEEIEKKLTPYQREIFNGICSISCSGQNTFTANQVYEAATNKGTKSSQALSAVTKAINTLRTTLASFDWTEHARMARLPDIEAAVYDDNIIHVEAVTLVSNGIETRGFHLLKEPALLTYAKATGQIATVEKKILDVSINNTNENIVLKNTLIRRIERMKNSKEHTSHNIRIDNLFETCQIKAKSRTEASRKKETVLKILDDWKQMKYIAGYNEIKNGKSLVSIEILL